MLITQPAACPNAERIKGTYGPVFVSYLMALTSSMTSDQFQNLRYHLLCQLRCL